jgi:DNA primase
VAGRITQRSIEDVIRRTDMLDVVREVVELKKAGSSWKGLCPFHAEKTPSFHVNPALRVFHCKGCDEGGSLLQFVQRSRGLSFVEAMEWLAQRLGVDLEREQDSPIQQQRRAEHKTRRARMLELHQVAQAWFRARFDAPEGAVARAYADKRGLQRPFLDRFGLGFAPGPATGGGWDGLTTHLRRKGFHDAEIAAAGVGVQRDSGGMYDRFRDRLMFPILTASGDLVAFGGRTLLADKDVAKYMNSPETTLADEAESSRMHHFYKKSECVFGLHQAKDALRRGKTAVLVEGNLDVVTLHQGGIGAAVCAMGTALTIEQAREVRRFADRVVLVYDGDAAGRKAALKAAKTVVAGGFTAGTLVHLPAGEDPDSFVRAHGGPALEALFAQGKPLVDGWLESLAARFDGSSESRAVLEREAEEFLAAIDDRITRAHAANELARLLDQSGQGFEGSVRASGRIDQPRVAELHAAAASAVRAQGSVASRGWQAGQLEQGDLEDEECWLVRILAWYPAVLPLFRDLEGFDAVQDRELRMALHQLALASHDGRMYGQGDRDVAALAAWADALPNGRVRSAFLAALVESPAVLAQDAAAKLRGYVEALWVRRLGQRCDAVLRECALPGMTLAQQRERMAEWKRLKAEMKQRSSNIRSVAGAAPVRSAAKPKHAGYSS